MAQFPGLPPLPGGVGAFFTNVPREDTSFSARERAVLEEVRSVRASAPAAARQRALTHPDAISAALNRAYTIPPLAPFSVTPAERNDIIYNDHPIAGIFPSDFTFAHLRIYLINTLLPERTVEIDLSGWDAERIRDLCESTEEFRFYIHAQIIQKQWYSINNAGVGEPAVRSMRYFSVFSSADLIMTALANTVDHYGVELYSLGRIRITKERINQQIRSRRLAAQPTRVAASAAGFKEVIIDDIHTPTVFFPATYSTDCFFSIMRAAINHLAISEDKKLEVYHYCDHFLRVYLNKKGISSTAIHKLNKRLCDFDPPIVIDNVPRTLLFSKHTFTLLPDGRLKIRNPSFTTFGVIHAPLYIHVAAIDFSGKFAISSSSDSLHYVWLKIPPLNFTSDYRQSMENEFKHIIQTYRESIIYPEPDSVPFPSSGRVDYVKLHQVNVSEMTKSMQRAEDARKALERARARKRKRNEDDMQANFEADGSTQSAALYQQSQLAGATTWIAIYDIESIFLRSSSDAVTPEEQALGIMSSDHSVHRPILINYAMFQLFADYEHSTINFNRESTDTEIRHVLEAHRFEMGSLKNVDFDNPTTIVNAFLSSLSARCNHYGIHNIYLFAHNGSKYDHFLLLRHYLSDSDCVITKPLITSRGLLGLNFEYDGVTISLRCSSLYFQQSLAELCIHLDIPKSMWKKDFTFDHDTFTPETYAAMTVENKNSLEEYAIFDIYSLFFIMVRLESLLQRIDAVRTCDITFDTPQMFTPRCGKMTLQSFIRSTLAKHYFKSPFQPFAILMMDELLLSAMRGGMTQAFTAYYQSPVFDRISELIAGGQHAVVDFYIRYMDEATLQHRPLSIADPDKTSLYPSTMKRRGVPKGKPVLLQGDAATAFVAACSSKAGGLQGWGVAFVRQATPLHPSVRASFFPVLSYRTRGGDSILYSNECLKGIFEANDYFTSRLADFSKSFADSTGWCWMTTDHLAIAATCGATFEVEACFSYSKMIGNWSEEYISFISEMFEARRANRSNKVIQNIYKLIMNGSFGSSGQTAPTTNYYIAEHEKDDDGVLRRGSIPAEKLQTSIVTSEVDIGGQFTLYKLECLDGCIAGDSSCKPTVTSSILSGSVRDMFDTFHDVAVHLGKPIGEIFEMIHYMDTDSSYADASFVTALRDIKQFGGDMGQMSTEAGEYILHGMFPMAKVYHYHYLKKKKNGKWKMAQNSRFKGLTLATKKLDHAKEKIKSTPNFDNNELFRKLLLEGHIQEKKVIWERGADQGVTTIKTDYTIDPQSFVLFSNKVGWYTLITPSGCIVQKWLPHGFKPTPENEDVVCFFKDFDYCATTILAEMEKERVEALNHPRYLEALETMKLAEHCYFESVLLHHFD